MASFMDKLMVHGRCREPSHWPTIRSWAIPWHCPWVRGRCHEACHGIGLNHDGVVHGAPCTNHGRYATVDPIMVHANTTTSMKYAMGTHGWHVPSNGGWNTPIVHGVVHGRLHGHPPWFRPSTMSWTPAMEHSLDGIVHGVVHGCLLYTSPSPRDRQKSRMPSSA